jgi:WD40 repeat protein
MLCVFSSNPLSGHAQNGTIIRAAWNPMQDIIAISQDYTVSLYTSRLVFIETLVTFDQLVMDLQWSPSGDKLAVSLTTSPYSVHGIKIFNTTTRQIANIDAFLPDSNVAWSSDNERVAVTWAMDRLVEAIGIYNSNTGERISSIQAWHNSKSALQDLVWRPNAEEIAVDAGGDLQTWNIVTQQQIASFPQMISETALRYSPSGDQIAFATDNKIEILSASTLQPVQTLIHSDIVYYFIWGAGGILSLELNGTTKIWDPNTGQLLYSIPTELTTYSAWNPSGTEFIYITENSDVHIRDAATGAILATLDPNAPLVTVTPTFIPATLTPTPAYAASITRFDILDPVTSAVLTSVTQNTTVNLAAFNVTSVRVRAITAPSPVGSVVFGLNANPQFSTDNDNPYRLSGTLGVGNHTLSATPYDQTGGTGNAGTPLAVQLTLINDPLIVTPSATFTPAPTITPTPTATPVPLVTNIQVVSGSAYALDTLAIDKNVYTDRTYIWTMVPTEFVGQVYLKGRNNDKNRSEVPFLTFTLNQPATLYLAYDSRITPLPSWASDWTATGQTLSASDATGFLGRNVYQKTFAAGTVSLGGNSGTVNNAMYTVIVVPQ